MASSTAFLTALSGLCTQSVVVQSTTGLNEYGEAQFEPNLVSNSSFEQGVANWGYYVGAAPALATLTQSSTQAKFGSYSAALTISSPASFTYWYVRQTASVTVSPSTQYTASAYLLTGTEVSSAAALNVEQYNAAGTLVTTTYGTASATTSTTEWARRSVTFTTGASTVGVRISVYTISRAGQVVYVDGVMLQTGATLNAFSAGQVTYPAYVQRVDKSNRDTARDERVAEYVAYIPSSTLTVGLNDEIEYPSSVIRPVVEVDYRYDEHGQQFVVVSIGKGN